MKKIGRFLWMVGLVFVIATILPISDANAGWLKDLFSGQGASGGRFAALDQYFINFILVIREPLIKLVGLASFIIGVVIEINAIIRITKPGFAHGKGTPSGTVGMLVIGAMMIALPSTINMIEGTIFDADQTEMTQEWEEDDLSYLENDDADKVERNERVLRAINAALQYVRIFGLIAFIRGMWLLKMAIDGGQSSMMSATLHTVGGVLAMNMAPVLRIFFSTITKTPN